MTPAPLHAIEQALPELFRGKDWLLSPEPFRVPAQTLAAIRALGPLLHRFLVAANELYFDSKPGTPTAWVRALLDAGKPAHVVEAGQSPAIRAQLPRVIRPDALFTAEGLRISEI